MLRKLKYISGAIAAVALLSGCDPTPDDGDSGHQKAMKEIALSYGAQAWLNWKSNEVVIYLEKHSEDFGSSQHVYQLVGRELGCLKK